MEDPVEDLGSLWATCSQMRGVCAHAAVEQSVALWRVLQRGSWEPYYNHHYRAKLITRQASIGNLEAYFCLGMCAIFVEDRGALTLQVDMLERSTARGHDVATCVLSMVRYRSNSSAGNDESARRLFRKVEGDEVGLPAVSGTWKNKIYTRRVCQVWQVLQEVWWMSGLCLVWPIRCLARTDISVEAEAAVTPPEGIDGTWSMFCSEECRIRYECHRFFSAFW